MSLIGRTPEGCRLKIFCKDPSRFLGRIFESAHATMALSATLEPFDFYRKTLGFPNDRTAEISLAFPCLRNNRNIVIVPAVHSTLQQPANHHDRTSTMLRAIANAPGPPMEWPNTLSRVMSAGKGAAISAGSSAVM